MLFGNSSEFVLIVNNASSIYVFHAAASYVGLQACFNVDIPRGRKLEAAQHTA